jgi:vancomycin aglycone glucosyltransferase
MRVLLTTYGSRGDVEPMALLAVQSRALGADVRVCAPPNFAELAAAQLDTVAAVAEECDARVATGVMPTGGWL